MSDLRPLQHVSSNGQEIWDWAHSLSRRTGLRHQIARAQAGLGRRKCGECVHWMTDVCPAERLNPKGFKEGPSCKGVICNKFVEKEWDKQRRANLESDIAALTAELEKP